jgi:bla regulator protein BlaR1
MISQNLIQSIGWTLIHSLWQGLAIFIVLKITVRAVRNSNVKYFMGVAAMALMVIASVITFCVLNAKTATEEFHITFSAAQASSITQSSSVLDFINQNIIWLLRFWIMGFVVGLLRIATGLYYINRLRRNSMPVHDEWMQMVNNLSETLNVNRIVAIAEAKISSPMVVGFMKPMILFPVGLLSGLTAEQVETILVHELSHIRRQDYIINVVQSVIETIFFFNPFALLISSMIREERENCCDDMVIAKGINPLSYVKTLAQLEAARSLASRQAGSSTLALGFTGNQNQLLNRIKRIMENSAKNDWGKGRFIPLALLFLGLVCASWLSINSEKEVDLKQEVNNELVISADTIIIEMPPAPLPDLEIPEAIEIHEFDSFGPDSIPSYHFKMRAPVDFEEFEREFTEKFKSQFKEFYEKNEFEFQKMFEEAKREESSRREAAVMVDLAAIQQEKMAMDVMHVAEEQMRVSEQQYAVFAKQMQESQVIYADMARRTEDYKRELVELLREDGYITNHDDIDNLSINDDNETLTVNGKTIKKNDAVKYRALQDKFFGNSKRRTSTGRNE